MSLMRVSLFVLASHMAMSAFVWAQSATATADQQPRLMDREREVALALSACPPGIASQTAVYVLQASGYVKARDGQNGFTAIVEHSEPTSQEPQCMDAEGTRTFLPRILKAAEWRAQGKSSEEITQLSAEAFAKGTFQPPSRPGVDYMLSTENIVPVGNGKVKPYPPHVMFYGPYMTNADIGSTGKPDVLPFVVGGGSPHALIIVPAGAHAASEHSSSKD